LFGTLDQLAEYKREPFRQSYADGHPPATYRESVEVLRLKITSPKRAEIARSFLVVRPRRTPGCRQTEHDIQETDCS
jgi:hypothetical protein